MLRSLRSYPTPRLAPFLVLGLCWLIPSAVPGADTKDTQKVQVVEGPPAVSDGLEVRMSSPARFVEGERLRMFYKFTNLSREGNFALYNKLFDGMYADDRAFSENATIVAVNLDTKETFETYCASEITRKKGDFRTVILEPSKSWEGRFEFARFLRYKSAAGGKDLADLPPGKYRMTVTWKFPLRKVPVDEGPKASWYGGVLEAKPFEFEIAKAAK